jgi:hypothetical protein
MQFASNGSFPFCATAAGCPEPPFSYSESGHSAEPHFRELGLYEAAVGDLTLSAINSQSNASAAELSF